MAIETIFQQDDFPGANGTAAPTIAADIGPNPAWQADGGTWTADGAGAIVAQDGNATILCLGMIPESGKADLAFTVSSNGGSWGGALYLGHGPGGVYALQYNTAGSANLLRLAGGTGSFANQSFSFNGFSGQISGTLAIRQNSPTSISFSGVLNGTPWGPYTDNNASDFRDGESKAIGFVSYDAGGKVHALTIIDVEAPDEPPPGGGGFLPLKAGSGVLVLRVPDSGGADPPGTPTGLLAGTPTTTSVPLSWALAGAAATSVEVRRSPAGANTWTTFATLGGSATATTASGLAPDTAYDFAVRALNAAGASSWSASVTRTTDEEVSGEGPGVPANLQAIAAVPADVAIAWDRADDTDAMIEVQRAPDSGGSPGAWATIATLPAHSDICFDRSVWPATKYHWRCRAANGAGVSAWSDPTSTTTEAGSGDAPTITSVVPTGPTRATVSWPDPGSIYTAVECSTDGGITYRVAGAGAGGAWSADIEHLAEGVAHRWRIRHWNNGGGTTDYSATVDATQPSRSVGIPACPTDLEASPAGTTSIGITWTNNSGPSTLFEVQIGEMDAGNGFVWWETAETTAAGATSHTFTGRAVNTLHSTRVRAVGTPSGFSEYAPARRGKSFAVTCAHAGGRTIDVGPGKAITMLGGVDWSALGPGDLVRIHPNADGGGNPIPYREYIGLASRGTPGSPITIRGIPHPITGALPVISGDGAVIDGDHIIRPGLSAIVQVGGRTNAGAGKNCSHVVIEYLDIRDTYRTPYTVDGVAGSWGSESSGINILGAYDVTIRGCDISNCACGFFANTFANATFGTWDLLIEGNYIHGCGNLAVNEEGDPIPYAHGSYSEVDGITYQYNHYGPNRPDSPGAAIKDRSVGTVVRYNRIDGGLTAIQMPEAQGSAVSAVDRPDYRVGFVYGNLFKNSPGNTVPPIWFGVEGSAAASERRGICHAFHNTIVIPLDGGTVAIANTSNGRNALDARNNIFASLPLTGGPAPLLVLTRASSSQYNPDEPHAVSFGRNWITAGYAQTADNGGVFVGMARGQAKLLTGTLPGFAAAGSGDYTLAGGSPCRGAGGVLSGAVAAHPVTRQYAESNGMPVVGGAARSAFGPGSDLGAFQS